MKRIILFVLFSIPLSALADPAPIPQAFDIRLDGQQLTVIQQALMKVSMPYEQTAPVLQSISQQIHDQAQAAAKEEKK